MLEDYNGVVKSKKTIEDLSPDLFGDQIDVYSGSTVFAATDASVPTNSGIALSIGRKLSNAGPSFSTWLAQDPDKTVFGRYWVLDIPHMRGTYDARTGWVVKDQEYVMDHPETWAGSAMRCSGGEYLPPTVPDMLIDNNLLTKEKTYKPGEYFSGITVSIPGQGDERLLNIAPSQLRPGDGLSYYGSTKSHWRAACTPSVHNGSGEGFLVLLPNGLRYTFDWMVKRKTSPIEGFPTEELDSRGIERTEVFLYATKVEDRFGNAAFYTYDPSNPHRLLSIRSSDGAQIAVSYNGSGKIESISAGTRIWRYEYVQPVGGSLKPNDLELSGVILPDGSRWGYQYSDRFAYVGNASDQVWQSCSPTVGTFASDKQPDPKDVSTLTISHPSGAVGEFRFRKLVHGTNRAPTTCVVRPADMFPRVAIFGPPPVHVVSSLDRKTISGPGVASMSWNYAYTPSWSRAENCGVAVNCDKPTETVSGPTGNRLARPLASRGTTGLATPVM
ncbi:hypothetical protein ACHZ97_09660 [Lysobacter soli]|uniref:hypothetical protein n=1 Tax=Lysobacter soli TaxID=453783 RepID=UPI0037CA80F8